MSPVEPEGACLVKRLDDVATLDSSKVLAPAMLSGFAGGNADKPVLVVLAAGKGTRFGENPKCVQLVNGKPLAAHSIDAFHEIAASPAVCVVGYRKEDVVAALGDGNVYVASGNAAGGTGFAA